MPPNSKNMWHSLTKMVSGRPLFFNSLIIFSTRIVIITELSVNMSPDKKTAEMSNCIKFHVWL